MQPPPQPVLTVTQLTRAIKLRLESGFPNLRLQGEVSNLRRQASGHLYFSLKDAEAQISAVMFRGNTAGLRQIPREGDQIVVDGQLNVYPPRGGYQIVVRSITPVGLGELLLRFEQLKQQLHARGWFDPAHKKPLPQLPRRIGVVSSPTGAAIQDILNVLRRRFSGFQLLLNPVLVQGAGAAEQVAQALHDFNRYQLVDVIIVARGGGSIEDLWAFNEEVVAEAIFSSQIPVISAIGHETDNCLSDFVADVRAPTPSAAAEMVIHEKASKLQHLAQLDQRLKQILWQRIQHQRHSLRQLARHPVLSSPYPLIGPHCQRMDDWRESLDRLLEQGMKFRAMTLQSKQQELRALRPDTQLRELRQRLQRLDQQLSHSITQQLQLRRQQLDSSGKQQRLSQLVNRDIGLRRERLATIQRTLESINPKKLLTKGYSIVFSEKDDSVINSVLDLESDPDIRLMLADGDAFATVRKTLRHEPKP